MSWHAVRRERLATFDNAYSGKQSVTNHHDIGSPHLQSGEFSRMESKFLLSEALRHEFETRTYIPMSRLAELLPMDPKTLAEHVRRGNIEWRRKGFGKKRPRRVVTRPDVIAFLLRIYVRSEDARLPNAENVVLFPTRASSAIPNLPIGTQSSKLTASASTRAHVNGTKRRPRRSRTAGTMKLSPLPADAAKPA